MIGSTCFCVCMQECIVVRYMCVCIKSLRLIAHSIVRYLRAAAAENSLFCSAQFKNAYVRFGYLSDYRRQGVFSIEPHTNYIQQAQLHTHAVTLCTLKAWCVPFGDLSSYILLHMCTNTRFVSTSTVSFVVCDTNK